MISFKNAGKRIKDVVRADRKMLLLGVLLALIAVGVVSAAIYTSMHMQGNIGVESALILSGY